MAATITFQQLEELWPLPNISSLSDLIEDRERSESLRSLLDAHENSFSDIYECARILFGNGFLSFELSWGQNEVDVELAVVLPKNFPTQWIRVDQRPASVAVYLKQLSRPILDAKLWGRIDVDDSQWTVERRAPVTLLKLELHKHEAIWWTQLFDDRQGPGPRCKDELSPERAYTYAQTFEMTSDDPEKVFSMYRLAADYGHPLASSRVGNTYIDGNKAAGVEKNERAALHYLTIGAENGNYECMFQVGHAFQHGIVYEADFDKAVFWYTQAAAAGHHVRAAYYLGHIYHNFPGRPSQPDKAAYWWQRAAEQGHPDSMFNLGLYFYRGADGVAQSKATALDLFKNSTVANPSLIELLHQNGIDLELLEAEVSAHSQSRRATRSRRRRPKKSSSWHAFNVGASVVGVAVVLGLVWYNRDAIRFWVRRRPSSSHKSQSD